jgi:hypothetical protein
MGMRTGPALLAVAVLLALAGCVPSASHPTAAPSASATPVFGSDAEALAAAEKAYAAYESVSDQILIDGGSQPERLKVVASETVYKTELAGFKRVADKGWRSTGGTTFDHFSLQSYAPHNLKNLIEAYVCSDVSKVDVLNSAGQSVVSASRGMARPCCSRQTMFGMAEASVDIAARRGIGAQCRATSTQFYGGMLNY